MLSWLCIRPQFNAVSGRRSCDIKSLVTKAAMFSHVFVMLGDKDVREQSTQNIYENYRQFEEAVYPTKVRFCGHFKRKDLLKGTVESNNLFYYKKLGRKYKIPHPVKKQGLSQSCSLSF